LRRAVVVAWLGAAALPAAAQDWLPSESLRMAIFNLEVSLDLEREALAAELERMKAEIQRREQIHQQLTRRLEEVRALTEAAGAAAAGAALDQKENEARVLQAQEISSSERIRALLDYARAREKEVRAGEERLAALRAQLPPPSESLTGLWDVLISPGGGRAVFALRQSGTLLAGEYLQDGGHHGSLEGTLIDGKVTLSRIDSRQGRSMDLDGKVASDGSMIRGAWQSLDVSGGKPGSGAWTARRRPEPRPEPAPSTPESAPSVTKP